MDISKVYVPDHQKWENYYDDLLSQRLCEIKNTPTTKQPDDSLVSSERTSVPKETSSDSLNVKLVSPIKQINDQVTTELRRDLESDSIKISASKTSDRSMKRRTKKGAKKGNKKQKTQRRKIRKRDIKKKKVKKSVKRRNKDIFTL